jgi:hypothetical protein
MAHWDVGVLFDDAGQQLLAESSVVSRKLDCSRAHLGGIEHAIVAHGYVRVRAARGASLIMLDPAVASHLAVNAAFYELADYPQPRVILTFPDERPFELFSTQREAQKRVEALLKGSRRSLEPGCRWPALPPVPHPKGQHGSSSPSGQILFFDRAKRA